MEASGNSKRKTYKYSVKDPLNIVLTMLFTLVCSLPAYYLNLVYFEQQKFDLTIWMIAHVLLFMFVLRLGAVWNGVEFDFDKNTIEFPGGQISANSVVDYINPKFIFQFFGRKVIELDRISQISNSRRWGHKVFGVKINENKIYFGLNIIGDFGGATIWFMSEDKCDEAYSAIRQVNHMGLPVNHA